MKRLLTLMTAATLICAGAARSEVVPVANTGVDGLGNPLVTDGTLDNNYTILSSPSGPANAYSITTSAPGTWLGPDALSTWIGPSGGGTNALAGQYVYQTQFDLTNYDPNTFALTGQLSTDNELVTVSINGNSLGTFANIGNFGAWTPFNIDQTNAAGDFIQGVNAITFALNNDTYDGPNPSGLRVEMTADATATPEPGTLALFGFGLMGLGFLRRRQSTR